MPANLGPVDALTHFRMVITEAPGDILEGDNALHGYISSFTPPVIAFREVEVPNHGDSIQFVDFGLDTLTCELASTRYTGQWYGLIGSEVGLDCYSAIATGPSVRQLKHIMTGIVRTGNGGSQEPSRPGTFTVGLLLTKLRVTEGNSVLVDIDTKLMIRKIGGDTDAHDQLKVVRTALGLS